MGENHLGSGLGMVGGAAALGRASGSRLGLEKIRLGAIDENQANR